MSEYEENLSKYDLSNVVEYYIDNLMKYANFTKKKAYCSPLFKTISYEAI